MKNNKLFLNLLLLVGGLSIFFPGTAQAQRKPVAKKAPAQKQASVPIWTGTVSVVRTKEKKEGIQGMSSSVSVYKSISENYTINIQVTGERDMTGGIVNNFISNAKATFTNRNYREENIPNKRMGCDDKIIETTETQKMEITQQASKSDRILVSVSTNGGELGIISFTPPRLESEQVIARTYVTSCPSYDKVNTKTEKSEYPTEVITSEFYVEFQIPGGSTNELHGTKTVEESDGSKTIYSWDLTRNN